MKKIFMSLLVFVLLYVLTIFGSVQAQGGDDNGYPIETETQELTEPTQAPTQAQTQPPTQAPTQPPAQAPTLAPTQPGESTVDTDLICAGIGVHPVLNALANEYGVDYQELLSYFCDSGLGIGEITLAVTMLQIFEGEMTLSELVTLRLTEEMGWGNIFKR